MNRNIGRHDEKRLMEKWLSVRQAAAVAQYNFRLWHRNPRIWMTFFLAFIMCFLLSDKVMSFAVKYDCSMQFFEPFIWTFSDSNSILLASLLMFFLFADMPFVSGGTPFFLMRTSRRVWLIGQFVYIMAATLLYMLFVLVSTGLLCMNHSFLGNMWSETAARLGYSSAGDKLAVTASRKTMEMTTPYACTAVIFVLMLLYTLLLVFVMMVFNLYKGQMAGMIAATSFSVYGFLLSPDIFKVIFHLEENETYKANVIVGWLSPLNQAAFERHNFGYDLLPTVAQSVILFLILLMICLGFAHRSIREYSFVFTGTEGEI